MNSVYISLIIIVSVIFLGIISGIVFNKSKEKNKKEKVFVDKYKKINSNDSNQTTALELIDISKTYELGDNSVKALKKVSLCFRKSEFVSILGPSGCGKTTLLNIIGGLDRYSSGNLIINGVSTTNYKDSDWDTYRNNRIGFVFQNYNLIAHQTVLSNVTMALTLSGVSKKESYVRAKKVLKLVGLEGQENKKPNQLSGGQMQRVSIARALINNPDIILADEPTGALDTETSIQIMELLKEVAKDRLVIMVTHNPTLAENYSTRIINLLDGEKVGDSNPFEQFVVNQQEQKKGNSSMKVTTALSLSLSNLKTKKGRTILTSLAGSIGIIGIALVIAVSTGFSGYINKLQADTLSVYPITVSESNIDLTDFNKLAEQTQLEKYPSVEQAYKKEMFSKLTNMLKSNKITEEYTNYVNSFIESENDKASNGKDKWSYCIEQGFGYDVNNFLYSDISMLGLDFTMPIDQLVRYISNVFDKGMSNSNLNISADFVRSYIPTLSRIPNNQILIESQYDLLDGKWATNENELLLVVDSTNSITDITLALLGFVELKGFNQQTYNIEFGEKDTFSFNDIYQKEFYYLTNDNRYVESVSGDIYDKTFLKGTLSSPDLTLKISGVVRLKEGIQQGVLDNGIAYTDAFYKRILNDNKNSNIASKIKNNIEQKLKVFSWYSGDPVIFNMIANAQTQQEKLLIYSLNMSEDISLRDVAGNEQINKISIYSAGYEQKENLKSFLDKWNEKENILEEDKVHYSDATAVLFTALNSMVDAVKIVLIAFTAISLVVSSIMIGIITYVSVVERTKEIGILRSLGARKKDVSRIFNAETFLIGLFAGILGISISYLLTIPINLIVSSLVSNLNGFASLNILDAFILVVVSFALTLIAGVIPSKMAAKKDPVVALRTE